MNNVKGNIIMKYLLTLILVINLSSCTRSGILIPVSGPLSINPQTLKAEYFTAGIGVGKVKLQHPTGGLCVGRYHTSSNITNNYSTGSAYINGTYTTLNMNTISIPSGAQSGHVDLICEENSIFVEVEYIATGITSGYGMARDNVGNTFKVIF
jgi:hypothetical protein